MPTPIQSSASTSSSTTTTRTRSRLSFLKGRPPFEPLARWEIFLLALLPLLIISFGAITLNRSAYMQRRMTDAGVYFRAAWALTVNLDPYAVRDDNYWTYLYPPPLAIAAIPLADPPTGAPRDRYLPYPLSVVLWYTFGVACLAAAAHWTAKALELTSADSRVRSLTFRQRRWWVDRTLPMLICIPAIGSTISRGQVNIILLAGIAAMGLAIVVRTHQVTSDSKSSSLRGQYRAGMWLALIACVKIFPAYLGLYALATGRWRIVVGAILGTLLFMVALPSVVLGPTRMGELNASFARFMLLPHLGIELNSDSPVDKLAFDKPAIDKPFVNKVDELQQATGNQSFIAIIHGSRNLEQVIAERVIRPTANEQLAHWIFSAVITVTTLAAIIRANRRRNKLVPNRDRSLGTRDDLLAIATLTAAMLPISPVCHNHYFALHMPLIAALLATRMDRQRHVDLDPKAWLLICVYVFAAILPRMPGLENLRPLGVMMYSGLGLWALGVRSLWVGNSFLISDQSAISHQSAISRQSPTR